MAYTDPTAENFTDRFPEFSAVSVARIEAVIVEAKRSVDTSWIEADYKPAIQYLTAHMLAMEGVLNGSGINSMVPGALAGSIQQFSLGDASVTFGSKSGEGDSGLNEFKSTTYGRRYLSLLRSNKGGPRALNQ